MAITETTVTGPIVDSAGDAYDNAVVRFTPRLAFGDDDDDTVIAQTPVQVTPAPVTGAFSIGLAPSENVTYDVALVQYLPDRTKTYRIGSIIVPASGPVALQDLLPIYDPSTPTNAELLAALSAAVAGAEAAADRAEAATAGVALTFETIAAMAASDALQDGDYVQVSEGDNGKAERYRIGTDSTATADGALIVALTGVTGRAISTRTEYADFAELDADGRELPAGSRLSVLGLGGYTVVDAGEDIVLSGGLKVRIESEKVTPKHYGWTVGTADSTDFLVACIQDGRPVDWGDHEYTFSSSIVETLTHPVDWISSGALFKFTGSQAQDAIALLVGAHIHQVRGALTIDADSLCHAGFRVTNAPSTTSVSKPIFTADDLTVKNTRRHTLGLSFGSALTIYGAFRAVVLTRPSVLHVRLVEAAKNPGVVGCSGISISRSSDGDVEYAKIVDPYVDDVRMEETTDAFDQDGIVVFTRFSAADVSGVQDRSAAIIEGGIVKNARGRSVKMQGHNPRVTGLTVIKESTVVGVSGVQTSQRDVEFQSGGGMCRDLTVYLDGVSMQDVVGVVGNAQAGKVVPGSVVSGVRGRITGVTPRSIVFANDPTEGPRVGVSVSDILVDGPCESIVFYNATGTGKASLVGNNWVGAPTTQGLLVAGTSEADILLSNVVNSGASLVPLKTITTSGSNINVMASNTSGWSGGSGATTEKSIQIADEATQAFPYSGLGGYAIIGVQSVASFQAIIQLATNGSGTKVSVVTQTGSEWVVADSADPGSGNLRAWVSGGALQIKNETGFKLRFNVLIVG